MAKDKIIIEGAREHNLKNIDIEIPRDKFVVLTGISGSGKSSLAFDTIYAEGQRRYVESLSAYARQFLGQMEKPDLDYIEGLSPAISIDQKTTSRNPRSTVGTVTEIYDYLRLLYARIGTPHCYMCGKEISQQTVDQMVDYINTLEPGTRIQLLAPVIQGKKGEHQKLLEDIRKSGYVRARIDGEIVDINEEIKLEKNKKHSIEVIVDRIIVKEGINKRLTDSLETVLRLSGGTVLLDIIGKEERLFSQNFACVECGISIEDPAPRMFSFNSPFGKCPVCDGLGELRRIDPDLVIPDRTKSISEGAIEPWKNLDESSWYYNVIKAATDHYGFSMDTPICQLDEKAVQLLLYGNGGEKLKVKYQREYGSGEVMMSFEGVVNNLERRYLETKSSYMRYEIENFMSSVPCPECKGARLKKESLAVTIGGLSIAEVCNMSVHAIMDFFRNLKLTERQQIISKLVMKEVIQRLEFLVNVGLEYLTLSRSAGTLSGGEAQRIRLATQIGSSLVGVLYILDEPSIGLHQRDNSKLLKALRNLTDLGNTLLVVEHDEETMHAADYIIDMGPGAGVHGGNIVAAGPLDTILACEESITGQYLSGKISTISPLTLKVPLTKFISFLSY
jgi:excinuclease ABC subunit A